MRSIPIDVLRAFVAVVEARGFTRAAEELGRSQPTVSLQVKRLEELMEAPLFEKATRFELTGVGSVCLDYGKRLLRLHDDMLDEASRRKSPDAALRVGIANELVPRFAPRLGELRASVEGFAGITVVTDGSESLSAAFQQNELDIALVIARQADALAIETWRAPLRWYGVGARLPSTREPLPLAVPPRGAALYEAATVALRNQERSYELVCISADATVRSAAAAAGLAVAPMLEWLAPEGLEPLTELSLPSLPPVALCLLARSTPLVAAARRWAAEAVKSPQNH